MGRPTVTGLQGDVDDLTIQRFWARVDRSGGGTACWPWTGGRNLGGYGVTKLQGHMVNASRAAWIITNGPIEPGLYVLHHCDHAICVNPRHLYAGSQRSNVTDMDRRGRRARGYRVSRRGEDHQAARLTDETVASIRADMAAGGKQRHVAARYGVSHTYVGMLVRGEKRV